MTWISRLKKKVVFWAGDTHLLHKFPWLSWSIHRYNVDLGEISECMSEIRHGDIGLHRDWGYMSNLFIPGFMKHGWIHVEDNEKQNPMIVEAISEGVVCRSSYYPMYSDYTIILSPKNVTEAERRGACKKAKSIVGVEYDYDFKFNIEHELDHYSGENKVEAKEDLKIANKALTTGYDTKFSCTEVCAYSWWHMREQLGIKRKPYKPLIGRTMPIITADDFIHESWEIKWMSSSITADSAKKLKLHDEGIEMIANFRAKHPIKKRVWINLVDSGCLKQGVRSQCQKQIKTN